MRAMGLTAVLMLGCAGAAARDDQLTLRTTGGATQMTLGADGEVVGSRIQLVPSQSGYGGVLDSRLVDLHSDGQRIRGTIHDGLIDLHVSRSEEGLEARGMFGGRLGRLEASRAHICSSLGQCDYELQARGASFHGQRACRQRASMPMPRPVVLELPAGFSGLPFERQLMLLAILLGD